MASPTPSDFVTTDITTATTSPVVNLPVSAVAGDRVFIAFGYPVTGNTISVPGGTGVVAEQQLEQTLGGTNGLYCLVYEVQGAETTLTLAATSSTKGAAVACLVTGDDDTIAPEFSSGAIGSNGPPDPDAVTPTGGSKDYLFIIAGSMGGEVALTGADADYSNFTEADTGTAGAVTGNSRTAIATRQLTAAASDNPTAFTGGDATQEWAAMTIAFHPAAAGQTISVAQATETNTAQAVSPKKLRAVTQSAETDTAQAITARHTVAITQASETDTAQAVGHKKTAQVAQATETDTAQAVTPRQPIIVAVGQATETDTAGVVTKVRAVAVGQATETDTAQAIAARHTRAVAQATETDTAQAITGRKTVRVSFAHRSVDTVLRDDFNRADEDPLGGQWVNATLADPIVDHEDPLAVVGNQVTYSADEHAAARWIGSTFRYPVVSVVDVVADANAWIGFVNSANEGYFFDYESGALFINSFDSGGTWGAIGAPIFTTINDGDEIALSYEPGGVITAWTRPPAGTWQELGQRTDTTYSGPWFGFLATNSIEFVPFLDDFRVGEFVFEQDTAQTILPIRTVAVGQATETDTAQTITPRQAEAVGQATETDTAGVVTPKHTRAVGQATETDSAGILTPRRTLAVAQAVETDTAQQIRPSRVIAVGTAVETDTAQAVGHRKTAHVGQAVETDTARPITAEGATAVEQAVETDTAQPITVRKTYHVGLVVETDTAGAVTLLRTVLVGQAVETDTALALRTDQIIEIGQAVETDTAGSVSLPRVRIDYPANSVTIRNGRNATSDGSGAHNAVSGVR